MYEIKIPIQGGVWFGDAGGGESKEFTHIDVGDEGSSGCGCL